MRASNLKKNLSHYITIITLLFVLAIAAAIVPLLLRSTEIKGFHLDLYGTWLQGVLTPIAVIIAALTFFEQSRDQRDANRINLKSHFITSIPAFHGHINYLCVAALRAQYIDMKQAPSNLGAISQAEDFFDRCDKAGVNHRDHELVAGVRYKDIRRSAPFEILKQDISDIIKMANEAGYSSLLDTRIMKIDQILKDIKIHDR